MTLDALKLLMPPQLLLRVHIHQMWRSLRTYEHSFATEWKKEHMNMKINQFVVMYLDPDAIVRPVAPPDVSPVKCILLIRENPSCTILPMDSRNQESAQISGFWNPLVKWCNWDFL